MNNKEKRKRVDKALRDVKKLVRKHGLEITNNCLTRLKDYEKKLRELERAKREVSQLERNVNKK